MEEAVRKYIEKIAPEHRPLFDRMQRLIFAAYPDAAVALSYGIPTYKVGKRRLFVGAWQHGLSIYGWAQGSIDGFLSRHAELRTSKGTVRLSSEDAADVSDEELDELIRAALS